MSAKDAGRVDDYGPDEAVIERRPHTLFVTDSEIRERLGLPEKVWRKVKRNLDRRQAGRRPFPPKQAAYGNRRWWPAVYDFFAETATSEGSHATAHTTSEHRDAGLEMATPRQKRRLERLLDMSRGHF